MRHQRRLIKRIARFQRREDIAEALADFLESFRIAIDRDWRAHQAVDRSQIVDPVQMVRMGVGEEHGVETTGPGVEELLAHVRRCIYEERRRAFLHEDRDSAPPVFRLAGIAVSPLVADQRHAAGAAAAEDADFHGLPGAVALSNRR